MKDGKIIPITMHSQRPRECGPACLFAIFKQYSIKDMSEKEIISMVSKNSFKQRDWLYQIGIVAQTKKLKTSIITMSPEVIDPTWNKLKSKELFQKIEEELKWFKTKNNKEELGAEISELKAMLKYLKTGGNIRITPLTKEKIINILEKNSYIIAGVDATIAFNSSRIYKDKINDIKGETWGHVIIINGYKKNKLRVSNPSKSYTGRYYDWINTDIIIEAILRRNRNILVIND